MSAIIRPMRILDLPSVIRLVKTTDGLAFKNWETFWVLARSLVRNRGLAQVAVLNNEIVGCVFIAEGLMVMIHHLAVAPHARRHNLATRMVQAGLRAVYRKKWASRRVYVTTLPYNIEAQIFWSGFGFTHQAGGSLVLFTLDLGEQEWLSQ